MKQQEWQEAINRLQAVKTKMETEHTANMEKLKHRAKEAEEIATSGAAEWLNKELNKLTTTSDPEKEAREEQEKKAKEERERAITALVKQQEDIAKQIQTLKEEVLWDPPPHSTHNTTLTDEITQAIRSLLHQGTDSSESLFSSSNPHSLGKRRMIPPNYY